MTMTNLPTSRDRNSEVAPSSQPSIEANSVLDKYAQSLHMLQDLFEQAPAAIAILRGPNYVIEMANPMICQLWGRTKDQVLGKPLFEALSEAKHQGFEELLAGVLATGIPFVGNELPATLLHAGQIQTVYFNFVYNPMRNEAGIVTGVIIIATDATQQIAARELIERDKEKQLVRQQVEAERKRLLELFAQAPAGIAVLRGPEHVVELVNPAYLQLVGERPETIGKPVRQAFPELADQGYYELLDEVYKSGEPFVGNERLIQLDLHNDGKLSDLFVNFTYQPLWNVNSVQVEGIFVQAVEVTEIVQARQKVEQLAAELEAVIEKLHQANQELSQADQRKDEFVAVVTHDLRTPLTSIKGYAQLLKRHLLKPVQNGDEAAWQLFLTKYLRSTEAILQQCERMEKLITRLLEFSQVQAGNLDLNYKLATNLVEMVKTAVEDQNITREDYTFVLEVTEAEVVTSFDIIRIEQVLNNLISNAIKYSPPATTVTVGIESKPAQSEVVVWVRDQGYGISPTAQARLFERFYRERTAQTESVTGLGLGLYISQEIVNEHGGRIWVESQPGEGSTFYFTLPLKS